LLNCTSCKKSLLGSGLSEALIPVTFTTEGTAQSVLDNRISLLTDLNKTTDNLPTGVIATNATGSYLIENATKIIISGNYTNGATVQNGTSLSDLIVKSNDLSGAINKIGELSKTTDSSLGGVSNGDLVINSTIQRKLSSQLDNLKSVLEKQQGS
jgi:hypothetical protein